MHHTEMFQTGLQGVQLPGHRITAQMPEENKLILSTTTATTTKYQQPIMSEIISIFPDKNRLTLLAIYTSKMRPILQKERINKVNHKLLKEYLQHQVQHMTTNLLY